MAEIHFSFSDPEHGIGHIALDFNDLPSLTAEQRHAILDGMSKVTAILLDNAPEPAPEPEPEEQSKHNFERFERPRRRVKEEELPQSLIGNRTWIAEQESAVTPTEDAEFWNVVAPKGSDDAVVAAAREVLADPAISMADASVEIANRVPGARPGALADPEIDCLCWCGARSLPLARSKVRLGEKPTCTAVNCTKEHAMSTARQRPADA